MGRWCQTIQLEEKVSNEKDYIEQTVSKYQEHLDEALKRGVGKQEIRKSVKIKKLK
jgi:hypothetical protein